MLGHALQIFCNRILQSLLFPAAPLGLAVACQLVCLVPPLLAQSQALPDSSQSTASSIARSTTWHFRYDLFQMLFEQSGLRPIKDFDAALESPTRTVIVLLGQLDALPHAKLSQFIDDGGGLLLASDRSFAFGNVFSIASGPALARNLKDRYQEHMDCIRVSQVDRSHELTVGVGQLITNRSGWIIERQSTDLLALARLPVETLPSARHQRTFVGAMTSKRLVAVADHSIFTNGMMWHGDNALFAVNVCRLLCRGERDQILFLADGLPTSSYLMGPLANELPLPTPPAKLEPDLNLDQMLQVANQMVVAVEDSDAFNQILANRPRGMSNPIYRRLLLFALSGLLIFVAVVKLAGRTSKPTGQTSVELRHRLTRNSGSPQPKPHFASPAHRGEAAQQLARCFCRDATSSDAAEVWGRELSKTNEPSETLARVLALAMQPKPPHFSEAMLLEFARDLAQLKLQSYHQPTKNS